MAASGSASKTMSRYSHTSQPSRTCSCAPTTHPGSFRCSKHKKPPRAVPRPPSSVTMAAKANSLKAILLQMLKPSSHDLHRRKTFQRKPTRFCLMNGNTAAVAVSVSVS